MEMSHRARLADDMGAERHGADVAVPANRHAFRLVLIFLSYKSFVSVAFGAMAVLLWKKTASGLDTAKKVDAFLQKSV